MKSSFSGNNAIIPTIIFAFIIMLSIVQLLVSNRLSTDGAALAQLEKEINLYKNKNSILEDEILGRMSLTHIASEAAKLGFVKEDNITAISPATRIALHQ